MFTSAPQISPISFYSASWLNCSHSWQQGQQALTPLNRSLLLTMLMCSARWLESGSMHTYKGWHLHASTLGRCHPPMAQQSVNPYCWYWCSSSGNNSSPAPLHQWIVGCLWSWKTLRFLAAHEIASDVSHVFIDIFLGGRVGHLEGIWRCHLNFWRLVF